MPYSPLSHRAGPVEWVISDAPADPSQAGAIRRALAEWLTTTAFTDQDRGDIALAVYEALANAAEHAYSTRPSSGTMTVHAAYSAIQGALEVSISDHGAWRPPVPDPMRGNGIRLMTALSDGTSIDHTDHGTTVLMHWSVA